MLDSQHIGSTKDINSPNLTPTLKSAETPKVNFVFGQSPIFSFWSLASSQGLKEPWEPGKRMN